MFAANGSARRHENVRKLLLVFTVGLVGWLLYQRYVKAPPPLALPPPPPPAINMKPTPILNEKEIRQVLDSIHDGNPGVRWEAVKFLDQLNSPQLETIIPDMLARDSDTNLRKNLVNLIAERYGAKGTPLLVEALKDENADVRVLAIQTLAKVGDYSVASPISAALNDVDERVRLAALTALNSIQNKKNEEVKQERARQEAARQETIRKQEEASRNK